MKPIGRSNFWKKHLGDWGINVYNGCEHGCTFCYAPAQPGVRAQRFWDGKTQADWGHYYAERDGLVEALRKQLRTFIPGRAVKTPWGQGRILVSFLCVAYQPLEEKLQVTRQTLELVLQAGHRIRIQTRATLVRRDFDLLVKHKYQVRLGTSLPYLDDDLARVLEPKAPAPTARLEMLREAAQLGIPVYVAVAPFLPFHKLTVLDEVVAGVKPLHPAEIFCEVLNPKGDCVARVAQALARTHPSEASEVADYDDAAWSRWTYEVLRHGVERFVGAGFVAWPDTSREWADHLPAGQVEFLNQFLPPDEQAANGRGERYQPKKLKMNADNTTISLGSHFIFQAAPPPDPKFREVNLRGLSLTMELATPQGSNVHRAPPTHLPWLAALHFLRGRLSRARTGDLDAAPGVHDRQDADGRVHRLGSPAVALAPSRYQRRFGFRRRRNVLLSFRKSGAS
jgi:DNA repair photolyase